MKKCLIALGFSFFAALSLMGMDAVNPAVVPVMRNSWLNQHERQVREGREEKGRVMFLGDSITAGWNVNGKDAWAERYAGRGVMNFGISGDDTEHVLWRLQNGALGDGIEPEIVVLLIGTNNTWRDSAPQIAEGVEAVVRELQKRVPVVKILLFGIFPRGMDSISPVREKIEEVNRLISKLADGETVMFRDIGGRFLRKNGRISQYFMYDYLHLTAHGYEVWADEIDEVLELWLK